MTFSQFLFTLPKMVITSKVKTAAAICAKIYTTASGDTGNSSDDCNGGGGACVVTAARGVCAATTSKGVLVRARV